MPELTRCSECGSPLPDYWPKGLCPQCALDGALEEPSAASQGDEAAAARPATGPRSQRVEKGEVAPEDITAGLQSVAAATGDRSRAGRFGDYELLEEVARGGMGVIYRARQVSLNRIVALKMILAGQFASKQEVLRFRSEAEAAATLQHPNIVRIHETGEHDGRHYFSMDYVEGRTLAEIARDGPLPAQRAAGYARQIAEAIHYAHSQGVLHRDLKPSNIVIDTNDQPRIADFGLAKRVRGDFGVTVTGQVLGSPNFMPPEQTSAKGGKVGPASDVYGVGAILYCLLAGRPPFHAETIEELLLQLRDADPVAPHLLNPSVPQDLETICLKCLEKEPTRRYPTAQALADELGRFLRDEPIQARPLHAFGKLWRWCRRRPSLATASAAAALATLLAIAVLVVANVRITRETNQKDVALQEKDVALSAAQTSEQRAKEQLFVALKNQAQARRNSRQMGQRLETLDVLAEALRIRGDPEIRDQAIAAMALPDVRRGPKWPVLRTNSLALAFDAVGQSYAVLDRQGVLTVHSVADNRQIHRFETGRPRASLYISLAFSPDGKFLAKAGDAQRFGVWSLENGESILRDAPSDLSAPTFSANGRWVALAGFKQIRCFDLTTGGESNRWNTTDRIHGLQFHPSDLRIAVSYKGSPWVSVYDATDGRLIAQLEVGKNFHAVFSWHPDGKNLAIGGAAFGIQIWDVETQQRVARLESRATAIDHLTFHPSGHWLVSWGWEGVISLWDPTTQRKAMQIPLAASHAAANLQFSRDGLWLGAFCSGEDHVQRLEFVSPEEYFTLHSVGERLAPNASATSADGRLLAVAMADGVRLWDFPHRREIARVPCGAAEGVLFESGGAALWISATTNGLQRWPITHSGTNTSELRLGPPQRIDLPPTVRPGITNPFAPERISTDGAVQMLAAVSEPAGRTVLVDLATHETRDLPVRHPMIGFVALSPDAKWLATSGWHSDRAQLWNMENGQLVRDWIVGLQTRVAFTPDSRELIVGRGSDFQFLKVDTLETSRQLTREVGLYPGDVAFSPDGKLMAMEMSSAVIHLKEASTGRTVAQLEDPFGDRSDTISFSRDGAKLIVISTFASAIHVWDLRIIRTRLKTMGLDWDWPEFPPEPSSGNTPLRIELIPTESR